jgi:hypothetical protein
MRRARGKAEGIIEKTEKEAVMHNTPADLIFSFICWYFLIRGLVWAWKKLY